MCQASLINLAFACFVQLNVKVAALNVGTVCAPLCLELILPEKGTEAGSFENGDSKFCFYPWEGH